MLFLLKIGWLRRPLPQGLSAGCRETRWETCRHLGSVVEVVDSWRS